MRCKICQNEFKTSKYRPNQQVCSRPECQKLRQTQNLRDWRLKNPDYFRYLDQDHAWKDSRRQYNLLWRKTHKEDTKKYEAEKRPQRRAYMREYMRKYRTR